MGKIFDNTLHAFDPFLDDKVTLVHGSQEMTIDASVFPIEDADPFLETTPDSDLQTMNVTIAKFVGMTLEIGDKLKYDGKVFNVMEVSRIGDLLDLKVRG